MPLQQQSPINLHDPIITDFGKSGLEIHLKKSAVGHVEKDEHGVQVVFGADERQFVKLNDRKYHLVQFHFHHPSEHWLNRCVADLSWRTSIRSWSSMQVPQIGITSYSTASPFSIWSMARRAAISRSVVRRQSEFNLLTNASETG